MDNGILRCLEHIAAHRGAGPANGGGKFLRRSSIAPHNTPLLKDAVERHLVPAIQPNAQDAVGLALKKTLYRIVVSLFQRVRVSNLTVSQSGADKEDEALFAKLYDVLDVAVYLSSDSRYVEASLPMLMIEDLMDALTLDGTASIFDFIESRVDYLIQDMSPDKGKGLGVNLKGDFNTDNVTVFEESMESEADDPNYVFYRQFWKMQQYLSNPPVIFQDKANWDEFKNGLEVILQKFDAAVDAPAPSSPPKPSSDRERKRKDRADRVDKRASLGTSQVQEHQKSWFFPKYLTSRNLFHLELVDPYFRRQILVQFLIIFQFLLVLSKPVVSANDAKADKPADVTAKLGGTVPKPAPAPPPLPGNKSMQYPFSLTEEQEVWVTEMRSKTMKTLNGIPPNGKQFSNTLTTVITHEKNWIKWKSESCPSFEHEPVVFEAKKRKLEPPSMAISKEFVGSEELSKLWAIGQDSNKVLVEGCNNSASQPLKTFLKPLQDQTREDGTIDPDIEEEYLMSKDKIFNWRAYRIAMREQFSLFRNIESIDTLELLKKFNGPPPAATVATPVSTATSFSNNNNAMDTSK